SPQRGEVRRRREPLFVTDEFADDDFAAAPSLASPERRPVARDLPPFDDGEFEAEYANDASATRLNSDDSGVGSGSEYDHAPEPGQSKVLGCCDLPLIKHLCAALRRLLGFYTRIKEAVLQKVAELFGKMNENLRASANRLIEFATSVIATINTALSAVYNKQATMKTEASDEYVRQAQTAFSRMAGGEGIFPPAKFASMPGMDDFPGPNESEASVAAWLDRMQGAHANLDTANVPDDMLPSPSSNIGLPSRLEDVAAQDWNNLGKSIGMYSSIVVTMATTAAGLTGAKPKTSTRFNAAYGLVMDIGANGGKTNYAGSSAFALLMRQLDSVVANLRPDSPIGAAFVGVAACAKRFALAVNLGIRGIQFLFTSLTTLVNADWMQSAWQMAGMSDASYTSFRGWAATLGSTRLGTMTPSFFGTSLAATWDDAMSSAKTAERVVGGAKHWYVTQYESVKAFFGELKLKDQYSITRDYQQHVTNANSAVSSAAAKTAVAFVVLQTLAKHGSRTDAQGKPSGPYNKAPPSGQFPGDVARVNVQRYASFMGIGNILHPNYSTVYDDGAQKRLVSTAKIDTALSFVRAAIHLNMAMVQTVVEVICIGQLADLLASTLIEHMTSDTVAKQKADLDYATGRSRRHVNRELDNYLAQANGKYINNLGKVQEFVMMRPTSNSSAADEAALNTAWVQFDAVSQETRDREAMQLRVRDTALQAREAFDKAASEKSWLRWAADKVGGVAPAVPSVPDAATAAPEQIRQEVHNILDDDGRANTNPGGTRARQAMATYFAQKPGLIRTLQVVNALTAFRDHADEQQGGPARNMAKLAIAAMAEALLGAFEAIIDTPVPESLAQATLAQKTAAALKWASSIHTNVVWAVSDTIIDGLLGAGSHSSLSVTLAVQHIKYALVSAGFGSVATAAFVGVGALSAATVGAFAAVPILATVAHRYLGNNWVACNAPSVFFTRGSLIAVGQAETLAYAAVLWRDTHFGDACNSHYRRPTHGDPLYVFNSAFVDLASTVNVTMADLAVTSASTPAMIEYGPDVATGATSGNPMQVIQSVQSRWDQQLQSPDQARAEWNAQLRKINTQLDEPSYVSRANNWLRSKVGMGQREQNIVLLPADDPAELRMLFDPGTYRTFYLGPGFQKTPTQVHKALVQAGGSSPMLRFFADGVVLTWRQNLSDLGTDGPYDFYDDSLVESTGYDEDIDGYDDSPADLSSYSTISVVNEDGVPAAAPGALPPDHWMMAPGGGLRGRHLRR
ncbi:MAG: hypothetical protein ACPGR8_12370, partial [Limisphaerales bacterium]